MSKIFLFLNTLSRADDCYRKHFRSLIAVSWIVECLIQGDRIGDIIKLGTVIYI